MGENSARNQNQPKEGPDGSTVTDTHTSCCEVLPRNAGISGYNGDYFCSVIQVGCTALPRPLTSQKKLGFLAGSPNRLERD